MWRVWIEIPENIVFSTIATGHPPCGGCGLKYLGRGGSGGSKSSPSVWRVWIEIALQRLQRERRRVTLRVEGVD